MTSKETHIKNTNTWARFAYMLLFVFFLGAGRLVLTFVILGQSLVVLVTGQDNDHLRNLGQGLARWIYQCVIFLSFGTEDKPFPFDDWPEIVPSERYGANKSVEEAFEDEIVNEPDDSSIPSFVADDANDPSVEGADNKK
jgi:hypothetical protein